MLMLYWFCWRALTPDTKKETTMTNRYDPRREQLLKELASDLADLVEAGELTAEEANGWLGRTADQMYGEQETGRGGARGSAGPARPLLTSSRCTGSGPSRRRSCTRRPRGSTWAGRNRRTTTSPATCAGGRSGPK